MSLTPPPMPLARAPGGVQPPHFLSQALHRAPCSPATWGGERGLCFFKPRKHSSCFPSELTLLPSALIFYGGAQRHFPLQMVPSHTFNFIRLTRLQAPPRHRKPKAVDSFWYYFHPVKPEWIWGWKRIAMATLNGSHTRGRLVLHDKN